MSSSTTRAATVGITLPTEPSLRIASSPSSMHVTGDISVWPNAARILVSGKRLRHLAQQRVRRRRGAPRHDPQPEVARLAPAGRRRPPATAPGTRKMPVTFSASSTSSSCPGSNAPSGWITVGMPSDQPAEHVADPGDVEQRDADEADVVVDVGAVGVQPGHRLAGQVGVGQHRALGPPGGARGVHDQRRAVVGDVDDGRAASPVARRSGPRSRARRPRSAPPATIDRLQRSARCRGPPVATAASTGSVTTTAGLAVLDQEGDLRRGQPEVHRDGDGAEHVGGQESSRRTRCG